VIAGIAERATDRVMDTNGIQRWLRVRPMRTRHGAAAIVAAASGVPQHWSVGMQRRWLMALMRSFAQAAGVRRRSFRLHRDRNGGPDKRDQQQKHGSNPLHDFW